MPGTYFITEKVEVALVSPDLFKEGPQNIYIVTLHIFFYSISTSLVSHLTIKFHYEPSNVFILGYSEGIPTVSGKTSKNNNTEIGHLCLVQALKRKSTELAAVVQ